MATVALFSSPGNLSSPSLTLSVHCEVACPGVEGRRQHLLLLLLMPYGAPHILSLPCFGSQKKWERGGKNGWKALRSPMGKKTVEFCLVLLYSLMVRSTGLGARLPGISLCSFIVISGKLLMLLGLQLSCLWNGNVNAPYLRGCWEG